MDEPSLRSSRLALAGGLAAALLVGTGGFLLGRATTERTPVPAGPPPAVAPAPKIETDTPRGVLGRADLIRLAASVADASAGGGEPQIGDVDGRRFVLRLPFGCGGPAGADSNAAMRWRYDADANALRLHVAPIVWAASDWRAEAASSGGGTIEGFWISRPWTSSEDCPAGESRPIVAGAEPVTLPGQTLALGQISPAREAGEEQSPRTYEAVVRVAQAQLDTTQGFRLRISGRIANLRGSGPVQCRQPAGPEQRPICLIGAVLDEVAIENPVSATTLAVWDVSPRAER